MRSECKDCEDQFYCIYLGQRNRPQQCFRQNCFWACCQIKVINEATPSVFCQLCNFLWECYVYRHIGRITSRNPWILQRYCRDHCRTKDCPHWEETTVDNIETPGKIDYSHLVDNGGPKETVDVQQQGTNTQRLEDRETPIPSGKGYPRMMPRVSIENSSGQNASAMTLIAVWNTRVFRTALTALTEPRTLWRRITRYTSPRRRVALHMYLLYFAVTYTHHHNDMCVTLFAGAAAMLKPFTQCLAIDDKPGSTWERRRQSWERRQHVWEHLESQSCIQFVFSSMYLCIYIATHLHTLYLDWLRSAEYILPVTLSTSVTPLIERVWDALRDRYWVNSEMHLEAVIERVWRCTWRLRSSELRDALGGRDWVSLEMHLEAMLVRTWRP